MSSFKYRIRYERLIPSKSWVPCVSDIYGVSAASALHSFHRWMQLNKEMDSAKNVIRPKLSHNEYRLTGLAQIYSSAASGKIGSEMIESAFELPANPANPDLTEKPKEKEDAFMGFMANLPEGRLAQ
jgi:hypothetical protein